MVKYYLCIPRDGIKKEDLYTLLGSSATINPPEFSISCPYDSNMGKYLMHLVDTRKTGSDAVCTLLEIHEGDVVKRDVSVVVQRYSVQELLNVDGQLLPYSDEVVVSDLSYITLRTE